MFQYLDHALSFLFYDHCLVYCIIVIVQHFLNRYDYNNVQRFIHFCFSCKTFIPCCCMHVICKNSHMSTKCVCQGGSKTCDPKSSSILAELAAFPTTLVAFLYVLRVGKYPCTISISSDVTTFVFETVIGYVWDKIFK